MIVFIDRTISAVINQQDIAELSLKVRIVIVERNGTVVRNHGQDKTLTRRLTAVLENIEACSLELNARLGKVRPVVAVGLVAKVTLLDQGPHTALVLFGAKVLGRALPLRRNAKLKNIAKRHPVEIGSIPLDA